MGSTNPNNVTEDGDDFDNCIEVLWRTINDESRQTEAVDASWKCLPLPIGRVKKIMKTEEFALKEIERSSRQRNGGAPIKESSDKGSNIFMLANEAIILQTKACEFFIREVTTSAFRFANLQRRKTIQKGDIWASVGENEMYDFLIDIIPRAVANTETSENDTTVSGPATNAPAATNVFGSAPAPFLSNTQATIPNASKPVTNAPPTTAEVVNVAHSPSADPTRYPPTMATEVAQPAFNFDNVSFVPMPQTPLVLDETVQNPMQCTPPSQQWTLEGNADM